MTTMTERVRPERRAVRASTGWHSFVALAPFVVIGLCLSLVACQRGPLHAAASMRVEVEVYKGPLSKDPHIQWGEMMGMIKEASNSFRALNDSVFLAADSKVLTGRLIDVPRIEPDGSHVGSIAKFAKVVEDDPDSRQWCDGFLAAIDLKLLLGSRYYSCLILAQLRNDIRDSINALRRLPQRAKLLPSQPGGTGRQDHDSAALAARPPVDRESIVRPLKHGLAQLVEDIAVVAQRLETKAFYWAELQSTVPPLSRTTRTAMAGFANLASEMANQIESRADALIQQLTVADRRLLPPSMHLRNAQPTDFLNLLVWNRAGGLPLIEEMLLHPIESFTSAETADRVRVIERLFADKNWSNINTVYASGQGDVRMVFIKDDIGNWSLKSFDNDPTELLNAYKDITKAGLKLAVDAAKNAASGGGAQGLDFALSTASRLARGRFGPENVSTGPLNVSALHGRALNKLIKLHADVKPKDKDLSAQIDKTFEDELKPKIEAAHEAETELADNDMNVSDDDNPSEADDIEKPADVADRAREQAIEVLGQVEAFQSINGELPAAPSLNLPSQLNAARDNANLALTRAREAKSASDATDLQEKAKGKAYIAMKAAELAKDRQSIAKLMVKPLELWREREALRSQTWKDAREILNNHAELVAVLEEAVAPVDVSEEEEGANSRPQGTELLSPEDTP